MSSISNPPPSGLGPVSSVNNINSDPNICSLNDDAPGPSSDGANAAHLSEKWRTLRLSVQSDTSGISSDTFLSLNTDYRGPVIPPTSDKSFRRRTLVLCFDGTGDQFDLDNSNVIQFFSVLKKGDRKRQLVYYQSGIGTYTVPQVATPMVSKISKTLDLMFALNLDHHVMSGYKFLMENYKDGDKICIFGFSRGAYTSRALAGMIHKVGLLPAGNEQQIPFAYKMYKNDSELGWKQSVAFKKTFSMDVDIDFVGVWDTVASVGLLPTTLPFTKSNTAIKVFRHALSLDEHRAKFKPSIYQRITAEEAKRGDFTAPPTRKSSPVVTRGRKEKIRETEIVEVKAARSESISDGEGEDKETGGNPQREIPTFGNKTKITESKITETSAKGRRSGSGSRSRALLGSIKRSARGISDTVQDVVERVSLDRERSKTKEGGKEVLSPDSERDQLEQMYIDRSRPTDVLEVWFAGCHCDVGGGSVPNATPNSLARIPLRWMIRECFLARTGIQFEADRLRDLGLDPGTLYPRVKKPPQQDSLGSSAKLSTPAPHAAVVSMPHSSSSDTSKERISKQDLTIKTENTASGTVTQENTQAVPLPEADAFTSSKEAGLHSMGPERNRQNNVSLDATLVNFTSDRESFDTPDVRIESASVVNEKCTISSHEREVSENVPRLEGTSPSAVDSTLKPIDPSISHTGSQTISALEAYNDVLDAKSIIYDQLKIVKWWWTLEFIPFRERVQLKDGTWKKKWSINRGRGRVVPQEEPLHVHRSVKMRMGTPDLKYKPRLKFDQEPIWVD